ncbi:MAG: hypothetical protein LBF33_03000, partial [Oscillospiraceae bacterium]|nr:hypothetical protein [Oscillospiraceae bacterium]
MSKVVSRSGPLFTGENFWKNASIDNILRIATRDILQFMPANEISAAVLRLNQICVANAQYRSLAIKLLAAVRERARVLGIDFPQVLAPFGEKFWERISIQPKPYLLTALEKTSNFVDKLDVSDLYFALKRYKNGQAVAQKEKKYDDLRVMSARIQEVEKRLAKAKSSALARAVPPSFPPPAPQP